MVNVPDKVMDDVDELEDEEFVVDKGFKFVDDGVEINLLFSNLEENLYELYMTAESEDLDKAVSKLEEVADLFENMSMEEDVGKIDSFGANWAEGRAEVEL